MIAWIVTAALRLRVVVLCLVVVLLVVLVSSGHALDYGVAISGVTVHFVDSGTDTGPIIAQAAVPVLNVRLTQIIVNALAGSEPVASLLSYLVFCLALHLGVPRDTELTGQPLQLGPDPVTRFAIHHRPVRLQAHRRGKHGIAAGADHRHAAVEVVGRARTVHQPLAAEAVEFLHRLEAAVHEQAQVVQDAVDHLALPGRVERDLLVQPVFEPRRVGQAALDGVVREQRLVDVQVGGVQRLRGAARTGHQHAHLGEGRARLVTELGDRALHVAQVGTAVARLVLAERGVDVLDHRLGVPLGRAAVPVVEADLAAEVQHQRLEPLVLFREEQVAHGDEPAQAAGLVDGMLSGLDASSGDVVGLRAAIEASAQKAKVALVCKSLLGKAHTVMAEGGAAAALGNVMSEDNWRVHFRDTMRGGKMHNNWRMAQIHAQEAPDRIRELEAWGALFDRTPDGRINQRPFGGHTYSRLAHVGDRTGLEMIRVLQDKAVHSGIDVHMECTIVRLFVAGGRIAGALGYFRETGRFVLFRTGSIVLATGGIGKAWQITSNSWEYTGDGHALAYEAGAELIDMEFVQFHPTGMVWPPSVRGILVTEGVRGEGGVLRNSAGERFMFRYMPEMFKGDFAETEAEADAWVKGERKNETPEPDRTYFVREIGTGAFSRSFRLPSNVDPNKVSASYKQGVLTIALPKREEAKPRRIAIEAQ